ncbi:hypothetical protein EGW08_019173 [Elysia chlorotica]|uniref:C2H2-type domain-containing protein n=1 Tax=Elysia chlorotica TaxID=188477 RepID=A0A3S1AV54_ELYCH|nr:hypothetical protein EGW08_019173 [Elysia chlorotica]
MEVTPASCSGDLKEDEMYNNEGEPVDCVENESVQGESESVLDTANSLELSENSVNISDTFITIETKDGQSSERIPFSQFLKEMVVDKHSGNFTLNLGQFLSTQKEHVDHSQLHLENESPGIELTKNVNSSFDKNSSASVIRTEEKSVLQSATGSSKTTNKTPDNGISKSDVLSASNSASPLIGRRSGKVVKASVPQVHVLRRSSRVPAKNKKFTQLKHLSDWEPKTLSSSSSTSSSSWNTQLMTLALAAETHKNTPQDGAVEENAELLQNDTAMIVSVSAPVAEVPSQEKDCLVAENLPKRSKKETIQVLEINPDAAAKENPDISVSHDLSTVDVQIRGAAGTEHNDVDVSVPNMFEVNALNTMIGNINELKQVTESGMCIPSKENAMVSEGGEAAGVREFDQPEPGAYCEEKTVHTASDCLYNSKTAKKYQPVKSVVQRTLLEALHAAKETTKNNLSKTSPQELEAQSSEAVTSPNIYYTIMEPKMEAQGHCLLVAKASTKTEFRVIELVGAPPKQIQSASKSYPQDRYFLCKICELVFTSTSSWLQHRQSVHNQSFKSMETQSQRPVTEQFQCGFCEQKFPHKFMLDIHIKRKRHSELKHFRCTLCKENFATHKAREEHWMTAHPARSCGLCGKQFNNIVMLRRHIGNNCHGARFRRQAENLKGEATNEAMVLSSHGSGTVLKTEKSDSEPHEVPERIILSRNEAKKISDPEKRTELKEDKTRKVVSSTTGQVKQTGSHKLDCQSCSASFFTSSGLWKHMMEKHHQFYPEGFKQKLLERLEKNQTLLANTENALNHKSSSGNKSKFFVVMNPKIVHPKTRLSVFSEEKEFTFRPIDEEKFNEDYSKSDTTTGENTPSKQITFNCIQCKLSFSSPSDYRKHCSKTHGECFEVERMLGAFQCTLCSDSYPCQFMLDKHLKKHVGKKVLPCTLCGLQFHKIQERRQHWKTAHPGIGCPNCGKMYASIKYLQKHISLNCQDHFPPSQKFLEFQKKQHNDFEMDEDFKRVEKKILRCHLCPKICSSVHGWRRHMTDAHEDVGFSKLSNTCIICGQLVYGYKALEKHILDKHAEDSGLPVEEEDNLIQEAVKKSDTDIKQYKAVGKDTSEITRDEFDNYQCPSCPKTHPDLRAIKTHMKTHVDMELECSHCGKTFKNPSLLKQHIQRHRKEAIYTCEVCNKSFLTLLKLNKHCKVHHAKGNFVCELCGASFALNEYLQKHRKCHTDIRPHSCSVCAKTFRTKPELRVHFLIHTRETPYTCQYCGRGFSQRGNYRTHLAQHTGVKPYQCDRCPLSFALKCHLTRHLATHDQLIQYRCLWCDKECTQRKHMQMHVLRVHQEDFVQHEEAMKLDTPTPIPESQARLYNRRPAKASKIRRQYRTKAERCDPTLTDHPEMSSDSIAQMIVGLPTKSEPMDMVTSSGESIIHVVEGMEEQAVVSCVTPEDITIATMQQRSTEATSMGNFEILVNDYGNEDHHSIHTKSDLPIVGAGPEADLLLQENMQLVVGENNEISIIIKNEGNLHSDLGVHQGFGPTEVHPSLQEAIAALAGQTVSIRDEGSGVSLAIGDLD